MTEQEVARRLGAGWPEQWAGEAEAARAWLTRDAEATRCLAEVVTEFAAGAEPMFHLAADECAQLALLGWVEERLRDAGVSDPKGRAPWVIAMVLLPVTDEEGAGDE